MSKGLWAFARRNPSSTNSDYLRSFVFGVAKLHDRKKGRCGQACFRTSTWWDFYTRTVIIFFDVFNAAFHSRFKYV